MLIYLTLDLFSLARSLIVSSVQNLVDFSGSWIFSDCCRYHGFVGSQCLSADRQRQFASVVSKRTCPRSEFIYTVFQKSGSPSSYR